MLYYEIWLNRVAYEPNSKYCNTAGQLKYHKSNMFFFLTQVKCQTHHHIIFNILHMTSINYLKYMQYR